MNGFGHELLLASAGTGKTYRLTNQFLNLLLAGVEPERILATTFTRKAAGEILDRVLERLVEAVESADGLRVLQEALGDDVAPMVTGEACLALLVKLTRSLDTFQVRTLDSFFAHLVRLFALELELPPNWSIADEREGEALRTAAIQDVLEKADRSEMVELLRDLQQGGAGRGVQATLIQRANDLRSIALESADGAWSALRPSAPVDEALFEAAHRDLRTAPLAKTAKGLDMANWGKSRDKILAAIEHSRWSEVFTGGLGGASLMDEPLYYKKPLDPALLAALAPLVAHAKCEVLNQLVARNEALHALLERFEECYALRKQESGRYGFEDLPMALAPRTARARLFDEREAELWFRLDGRLDHLLLDEFQDTAPVQWRILAPLATEISSTADGERSFFCVGDPKQSIYGFRQAEPRLLQNLESLLPGLEAEHMHTSYRSSKVVLGLVNLVFGGLRKSTAFAGEDLEPYRVTAHTWSETFHAHEAARDLPGVVSIIEARPPTESERADQPALLAAVERVATILAETPHVEIGILTRVNRNIPLLIHALRQRGIDASGEGGNELTDSDAVMAYISLLHLADHPSDSASAFHVATSPFGAYIGLAADADKPAVREKARWLRRQLLQQGLGGMTEQLAGHVFEDEAWSAWDKTRFAQLVDQAHAFEERFAVRASDFVDHLRTHRVEAPGGARVRVMTVHASKGLEFDAVVLPELAASLVGKRDTYLAHRPDPTGLIEAVMLSPGKELLMLSPELKHLYDVATSKAVGDSLCNLYVALTRAKRRLELILPWVDPEKDDSQKVPTYASVLRAALPKEELLSEDPEGVLWRSPDNAAPGQWAPEDTRGAAQAPEPEPALALAKSGAPRFTLRSTASEEEGGATLAAADLLESGPGAEIGTLVHAAFERCEWIEDFTFDALQLETLGATESVVQAACDIVERALGADEIREALSRKACTAPAKSDVRVEREYRFSLFLEEQGGQSRFWNGAIDRLVVAETNGVAVWAEVLDYKSDAVTDESLAERVDDYRPQLEAYARVVSRQTGLAPDQVRLRLAFLSLGRVVDLTPAVV